MNSNITILSNIYIRTHDDLRLDKEFTSRVRGRSALNKLKTVHDEIVLTDWQENMRQHDTSCPLAENGEKTHGLVRRDGALAWEGRCEFKECERYYDCTEIANYKRDFEPLNEEFDAGNEPHEFDWLGNVNAPSEALLAPVAHSETHEEVLQKLKHALLNLPPTQANEVFAAEFAKIENIGRLDLCNFEEFADNSAILCRSGGEAEYASHVLYRKRVPHTFLREAKPNKSLSRCVADCLWDYRVEQYISKDEFVQRFRKRVHDDVDAAIATFDALRIIAKTPDTSITNEALDIHGLANNLKNPSIELPDVLKNKSNSKLTVSTIQSAKGLEFDSVYLLDSGFDPNSDNTEEALSFFEAFTCAISKIYKISPKKNLYVKNSETNVNRYIQLQRYKWTRPPAYYCLHIAIGLPSDFSETGFVNGAFMDALCVQEYIAKNVNIGDTVEIKLVDGEYRVFHKKNMLGYMPPKITAEFQKIASESRPCSNAPPSLSKVYVSNIVTIVATKNPEVVSEFFGSAKFWFGVELTGFPRIEWNFNPHSRDG